MENWDMSGLMESIKGISDAVTGLCDALSYEEHEKSESKCHPRTIEISDDVLESWFEEMDEISDSLQDSSDRLAKAIKDLKFMLEF